MNWRKFINRSAVEVAACSDVGRVRTENQDSYGIFPEGASKGDEPRLYIVADGMGGHAHGREASEAAVRVVHDVFFSGAGGSVEARLRRALEAANQQIFGPSQDGINPQKVGTTCTVLAWVEERAYLAHVGDSRAYRLRKGRMKQLSTDHTWVGEMYREGLLTEQEALEHPRRHTLTRAIGTGPSVNVDVEPLGKPKPGDVFLLCSDGLLPVGEEAIERTIVSHPLQEACDQLIQMANEAGGHDNVTVMLIRFG